MWDFIIKLPKSKDPVTGQLYNVVLVIIDRLTKWGYFIACTEEISAEDVTQVYVKEVFLWHRSLKKIILDKDLRFVAAFWEVFFSGTRSLCSNIDSISPPDRWSDRETEPDIGIVSMALCELHAK